MNNAEYNKLVNRIFNERYFVKVAPIYEDMVVAIPEIEKTPVIDNGDGVRIEVDNSNDALIAAYMASSVYMVGDEDEDEIRAYTEEERSLPVVTIASILAMEGRLTLIDPADSTRINAIVGQYLNEIAHRKLLEPNFTGPPEEDIEAFKTLREIIAPLVDIVRRHGQGTASWDQVIGALSLGGRGYRDGRATQRSNRAKETAAANTMAEPIQHQGNIKIPDSPYQF